MNRSIASASLCIAAMAVACGETNSPDPGTPAGTPAAQQNNAGGQASGAVQGAGSQDPAPSGGSVKIDMNFVKLMFGDYPEAKGRNRTTPQKVALGRKLYHEERLSRNNDISCATCHDLSNFGQDGKPTSPGTGGLAGKRNTPTNFNAWRQFAQFWDYRADTIEDQATMPILTANEHGLKDDAEIVSILSGIEDYGPLFKEAFPRDENPITGDNVRAALGAFQRKLNTRSRWDDFVEGDENALTDEEKRGFLAFKDATCHSCHMTRLLGGTIPQKLGLIRPIESADKGRAEVTGVKTDELLFKVPPLLNITETGPYWHDGSIESLEEVVRLMVKHQVTVPVSEDQIQAIMAFLGALTGELEDPSVIEGS